MNSSLKISQNLIDMYPRLAVPTATDEIPPTHPNFFYSWTIFRGNMFCESQPLPEN